VLAAFLGDHLVHVLDHDVDLRLPGADKLRALDEQVVDP
jgi:hypothetical protein